jgi:hypothetical protein
MIKINGVDVLASKPSDLDAQLLASTGCSSAEIDVLLAGGPDRAAKALRPFLAVDVLPGGALALAIASDSHALGAIRKLYEPDKAIAPAEPVAPVEAGQPSPVEAEALVATPEPVAAIEPAPIETEAQA